MRKSAKNIIHGIFPYFKRKLKISNHPKKFDERALVDSSSLCRGEPAVGLDGEIKMRVYNGQRDRRGRKCNLQVGFYSVTDPQVPYLNYEPAADSGQLTTRQGKEINNWRIF